LTERQTQDEEIFRQQLQSSRKKSDGTDDEHIQKFVQSMSRAERNGMSGSSVPVRAPSSNTYHYPSISRPEPVQYDSQPARPRQDDRYQPARPPKDYLPELPSYQQSLLPTPDIPAKESLYTLPTPEPSQDRPDRPPKLLDGPSMPPAKKQRYTFKPSAYLENGEPIRSLFLPAGLRQDFLSFASENTRRGIEMCGILCGTAVNNALFVQCLVIPEQKCTPDTCETENESALFDYCMGQDLLQLGWIHTHPTQSCFMSSRDLHTQAGYQVMLPESIAVVCAPKFEPE
jgi:STAM-binding protein